MNVVELICRRTDTDEDGQQHRTDEKRSCRVHHLPSSFPPRVPSANEDTHITITNIYFIPFRVLYVETKTGLWRKQNIAKTSKTQQNVLLSV